MTDRWNYEEGAKIAIGIVAENWTNKKKGLNFKINGLETKLFGLNIHKCVKDAINTIKINTLSN